MRVHGLLILVSLAAGGCGDDTSPPAGPPASTDGAASDGGAMPDGAADLAAAPSDQGPASDQARAPGDMAAGDAFAPSPADASTPSPADASTPSPADASTPSPADMAPADLAQSSPPSPVPAGELVFFSGAARLGGPVIDASPDEGGNIWAVSPDALYIKRAGEGTFRRYTNADGLHIFTSISAVAGGRAGEGWVGLYGYEEGSPLDDPQHLKEAGKAEHVWLQPDGTLKTLHYASLRNDHGQEYWETRSARRLLFSHTGPSAGHLFMGGNHGVTHIFNDRWGDHLHVDAREDSPARTQILGEWYGLAVEPATGRVWTCGRAACGLTRWREDPRAWVDAGYDYAFTVWWPGHDIVGLPVRYQESHVGVAIDTRGVAWFLSRIHGMASWDPATRNYMTIQSHEVPGLGDPVDVVADPDGTLWVADSAHVIRWDPQTNQARPLVLPSGDVRRLYMDTTVAPRALYVSTGGGLAVYRGP